MIVNLHDPASELYIVHRGLCQVKAYIIDVIPELLYIHLALKVQAVTYDFVLRDVRQDLFTFSFPFCWHKTLLF